jgi:hypothetical protein
MGVEIGTAGISSPGDFLAFGKEIAIEMDNRLSAHNAEVLWTNGRENGYVKVSLDKQAAQVEYIAVSTVTAEDYERRVLKALRINKHEQHLRVV